MTELAGPGDLSRSSRAEGLALTRPRLLTPGPALYSRLWNVLGFLFLGLVGAQVAAAVWDATTHGFWPAYDTNAYWLAARHLVAGQPLYEPSTIWAGGIYKYPPLFAQLALPIALFPEAAVDWAWRLLGIACLRYLCGSWRLSLIAALQWPVWAELDFGNVTLQLGAVLLLALRDRRGVYLLPWMAALKVGPGLLIVYLFATRPDYRRAIVAGCAVFAAACLISLALAPGLWLDYAGTFGWEASSQMRATFVVALVPEHGGTDFALRLAIAAVALLVAIRWRLDWLAFVAAAATMPIFSLTRLAVLAALWPLAMREPLARWCERRGRVQVFTSEALSRLGMLPRLSAGAATAAKSGIGRPSRQPFIV